MEQILIEVNQTDARYKETKVSQALKARMGTGGGNVPLVVMIDEKPDSFGIQSETRNDNE